MPCPLQCREFVAEQYAEVGGLKLHPGQSPTEVVKNGDGSLTMKMKDSNGSESSITAAVVMMATGRSPNTRGLGLEQVRNRAICAHTYAQGVMNSQSATPVAQVAVVLHSCCLEGHVGLENLGAAAVDQSSHAGCIADQAVQLTLQVHAAVADPRNPPR